MSALIYARLLTLLGLGSTATLVSLSVPALVNMGPERVVWRAWGVVFSVGAALALLWWSGQALRPLTEAPATAAARRAAAEHPFRFARFSFISALLSGLGTLLFLYALKRDLAYATLSGVITYLMFILPNLWIYLLLRRGLRRWIVASEAGPWRPEALGLRQPVGMRLAFAVQVPIIVCSMGMVLVEQEHGNRYASRLHGYYEARQERLLRGTLNALRGRPTHAASERTEDRPADVIRAPSLWILPPLLLLLIVGLTAAIGRFLAAEITHDMRAVAEGLDRLRRAATLEQGGGVGLREAAALEVAYEATLRGFTKRQEALREATRLRQEAERVKARLLAHLSHELKSPLNSVLGFSEVLLAELDGPLTAAQRQEVMRVWRRGSQALRFILALLDRAAIEAPGGALSAREAHVGAFLEALERACPVDPIGALAIEIVRAPGLDLGRTCCVDPDYTARAVMLGAGLLADLLEAGRVEIRLSTSGRGVDVEIDIAQVEALRADAMQSEALMYLMEGDISAPQAPAPLRLLRWLIATQGGRLSVSLDARGWPRFSVALSEAGR
ncbi:hypothetical protein KKB55_10030 [Myxococcota bacterium]|nr:hypothetical protein [Myxococcota bacterium]MBU1898073.1 hypothetical protein [Myxococcota bacterium]